MKKFKVSSLATVVSAVIYGTSAQAAEPTELTVTNPASYDGDAYIVSSDTPPLDFNQQDVVFTKNSTNNIRLKVDGTIKNVKDLTINGDGFINNGSITMSGKFTYGDGKYNNDREKINNGTMEVGSLYSSGTDLFQNKGTLTVNDGLIHTTRFQNEGTIISGKDTLTIQNIGNFGFTLKEGSHLQSKSGNLLDLVLTSSDAPTPLFVNHTNDLSLNSIECADFSVHNYGTIDVVKDASFGNYYVEDNSNLKVAGTLKIKYLTDKNTIDKKPNTASINANTIIVIESSDAAVSSLKADTYIVKRSSTLYHVDSLNINHLIVEGMGSGYFAPRMKSDAEGNKQTVHIETASFGGDNSNYSGIQIFNYNLVIDDLDIKENVKGMINFLEEKDNHASVGNLSVASVSKILNS